MLENFPIFKFFVSLIFFFMLMFSMVTHPLFLGMILVFLTLWLCLFCFVFSSTSWNGYILFLMFLGGLLILFLYNISMIRTETFSLKLSWFPICFCIYLMLFINMKQSFIEDFKTIYFLKPSPPMYTFFFGYNFKSFLFLVVYLFFCLICIVNIIFSTQEGGGCMRF